MRELHPELEAQLRLLESRAGSEIRGPVLEAIRAELMSSLYLLVKWGLGYHDMRWATHGRIVRALEAPTKRKLIVVPRGCFKSTIACVGYSIWRLIRNPNERILIDSELVTNSKTYLVEVKEQLERPLLTALFGNFKPSREQVQAGKRMNWSSESITIAQRTRIHKEASITAGGIGTTKVGQHYSVIIGDDYNSPRNSGTLEGRNKVISHYRYNQSILDPEGDMVLIGTRYCEGDLIGTVIEQEGLDVPAAKRKTREAATT